MELQQIFSFRMRCLAILNSNLWGWLWMTALWMTTIQMTTKKVECKSSSALIRMLLRSTMAQMLGSSQFRSKSNFYLIYQWGYRGSRWTPGWRLGISSLHFHPSLLPLLWKISKTSKSRQWIVTTTMAIRVREVVVEAQVLQTSQGGIGRKPR